MEEACKSVKSERMTLPEAAREYNIPVETLRRCVAGIVSLDCKPGPPTGLTSEEKLVGLNPVLLWLTWALA